MELLLGAQQAQGHAQPQTMPCQQSEMGEELGILHYPIVAGVRMSGFRLTGLSLRHYDALLVHRVSWRNDTRRLEEGTRACEKG